MSFQYLSRVLLLIVWCISDSQAHQDWRTVPDFINSIHGTIDLQEPVLRELFASPVVQRLEGIHQYGTYHISHPLPGGQTYTRLSHSLGVMKMTQLARDKGVPVTLAQIIAALLHDCSHTVFSHATDPLIMKGYTNGNYHDTVHAQFLKAHGIADILEKYGYSIEDALPDHPDYTVLEQPAPFLCADRLEYNLHSGYLTGLLSDEDRQAIMNDLQFENGNWYFTDPELALKLARVSLNDTLYTWGSPSSLLTGIHASRALRIMLEQNTITWEDIRYNLNDDEVWDLMVKSPDPDVQNCVQSILNIDKTFKIVQEGEHDMILKGKFSCLDPFIQVNGELVKLTDYNPVYGQEFNRIKQLKMKGWPIKFIPLKSRA